MFAGKLPTKISTFFGGGRRNYLGISFLPSLELGSCLHRRPLHHNRSASLSNGGFGGEVEVLDYWRLCDELNVIQAALLIAGCDPGGEACSIEGWNPETRSPGYEAAKTAISNALRRGAIKGQLVNLTEQDINGNFAGFIEDSIDLAGSRIEVDSLREWLAGRGLKTGFFFPFPEGRDFGDYLDRKHPRYAPKLAAAVLAWRATGNESAISGKSPKQALTKWLREHAADFGMTDEDGKPNETGIEEAAKVANWQPTGGAPKTPAW